MWIDKYQWDRIKERVEALEKDKISNGYDNLSFWKDESADPALNQIFSG